MDGFVLRNGEYSVGEVAGQPQADAMSPSSTARFSGRKLRMLLCCAGAPFLIMLDTNIVAVFAAVHCARLARRIYRCRMGRQRVYPSVRSIADACRRLGR